MVSLQLLASYFWWHYTIAIGNIVSLWWDFEWFLLNYFSIGRLLVTFFTPWKRLGEKSRNHFDLAEVATAIIVTTLMRLVGIVIRLITIISGVLLMIVLFPLLTVALLVWLLMPFILLFIFALGVELATKAF